VNILVIEDNPVIAELDWTGLEEARYTVAVAHDVSTGLEMLLSRVGRGIVQRTGGWGSGQTGAHGLTSTALYLYPVRTQQTTVSCPELPLAGETRKREKIACVRAHGPNRS
jgi:hypothetical protein